MVVKGKVGMRSHPHLFEACLMEKSGLACHDIFGHPTMKMHNLTYGLFEIGVEENFHHRYYYYYGCILCPLLVILGRASIVVFYYFIV